MTVVGVVVVVAWGFSGLNFVLQLQSIWAHAHDGSRDYVVVERAVIPSLGSAPIQHEYENLEIVEGG